MKVETWVDFSKHHEVDVSLEDITGAIYEALSAANQNAEQAVNIHTILYAFSRIGEFLRAFTDEQIGRLNEHQRKTIAQFLTTQGERFKMPVEAPTPMSFDDWWNSEGCRIPSLSDVPRRSYEAGRKANHGM